MMSAKTVSSETPACPAPVSGNNATAAAAPGDAPTDFQNLLAGVVAPPEPGTMDTLPAQPLAQLLLVKNPAQQKAASGTAAGAGTAATPLPAEVSPADLLEILDAAATLLPEVDGVIKTSGDAEVELPEDLLDADEISASDEALAGWLELMTPASVFAPQAGSGSTGDASQAQGRADTRTAQGLPASLMRQALVPEQLTPVDVAPQEAVASSLKGNKPDLVAVAPNVVSAFAAAMAGKGESTEKDKLSADGWMSALGELAAKRGHDVAPAAGSRISTPVHDARWADAIAHRLVMMARDGESTASIKLVPVDLGPLDIQISVRDGEASVHFGAANQETRNALEASLPRLRELLGAQGLQLSNASVSQQSGGQNRPEKPTGPSALGAAPDDAEVAGAKVISTSLLDIYA